jgi:hypothetical protein
MALGKTTDSINAFAPGSTSSPSSAASGTQAKNPNIQIGQHRLKNGGVDQFAHDAGDHADENSHGAR